MHSLINIFAELSNSYRAITTINTAATTIKNIRKGEPIGIIWKLSGALVTVTHSIRHRIDAIK